MPSPLHILALGDVHGHMHRANKLVRKFDVPDLILQVGDFEAHRHAEDLRSMDAPSKYKSLGDYADFHAGHASFPAPLYFIGGNHEPYAWLEEHPEGFSLTPEIHYLGRAGCTHLHGLHIAYLSGIHVDDRFTSPRPTPHAFGSVSNKAWIAFNHLDLDNILEQSRPPVDILIVHDWPSHTLLPEDAHLFPARGRTRHGPPGNPHARLLIDLLEPRLVLCGHMHTRYHRQFIHESGEPCDIIALAHIKDHHQAITSLDYHPDTRELSFHTTQVYAP